MQSMARQLVLHGNSLQPAKLAHRTDRQVLVANERDNGRPYVLVVLADGVESHTLDLIDLVWLSSNLQIFVTY
jgi:hypothetical protein